MTITVADTIGSLRAHGVRIRLWDDQVDVDDKLLTQAELRWFQEHAEEVFRFLKEEREAAYLKLPEAEAVRDMNEDYGDFARWLATHNRLSDEYPIDEQEEQDHAG